MSKPKNSGKRWTQNEVNTLKKESKKLKAPQIADKLEMHRRGNTTKST